MSKKIYLKDYKQPNYWIVETNLKFELFEDKTIVTQESKVVRNDNASSSSHLKLDGENLNLIEVKINNEPCDYSKDADSLTISSNFLSDAFTLKVTTEIEPHNNKALEGLYKSGDIYCTQCEAEGFRHITYFVDRPDNMAIYTTTIIADKSKYPYLLSNGNKTESKDLDDGRHSVTWVDPFKKPCYLFALVAGDLDVLTDTFTTKSGRTVNLEIYVDKGRKNKTDFAMESLKKSMKWDEERFDLEYDLDIYMIVAVDSFNMGAMENKGLNIFNSKYILADQETATDTDYEGIEAVIGHEYFHNWTGNRVTCRDWFQLSLKEGLTVYRDQEFTSDLRSRPVKRLQDVSNLRSRQFVEDAGPNAHPIRPSYAMSMDNLYTSTIYSKGAEVIRMIEKLIGRDNFKKGMDKYFELFDGQAVRTEDFVYAMEQASGKDLTHFKNWYNQAGTPEIDITTEYNANAKTYSVVFKQHTRDTPETAEKKPFHIPLEMGLISPSGEAIALEVLKSNCEVTPCAKQGVVVELIDSAHEVIFANVQDKPSPSFLREFSAPVKINYDYTPETLINLIKNDADSFNRWNAAQEFYCNEFKNIYKAFSDGNQANVNPLVFDVFNEALASSSDDPQFSAELLTLPSETYLRQFFNSYDPVLIAKAADQLFVKIAEACEENFILTYKNNLQTEFKKDGYSIGQRALANLCLEYLCATNKEEYFNLAASHFNNSFCMTNTLGAMNALKNTTSQQRNTVFEDFYNKWQSDTNVINNWLRMESSSRRSNALKHMQDSILASNAYDANIPNKIYSTVLYFCQTNTPAFHNENGEGYEFLADKIIEVDAKNPQVASRLCSNFNMWKQWGDDRGKIVQPLLKKIASTPGLSKNCTEIINNALN